MEGSCYGLIEDTLLGICLEGLKIKLQYSQTGQSMSQPRFKKHASPEYKLAALLLQPT